MEVGDKNERRLIYKIIETQDLKGAISAGISPSVLSNPLAASMLKDIINYYHNREHYGRVPQPDWMKKRFPGSFHPVPVPETLGELCANIRFEAMDREVTRAAEEVIELTGYDPQAALEHMRSAVLRIGRMAPKSTDRVLAEDADDIISRATQRRHSDKIIGIPFPWEPLNDLTQGIQSEDFIVLFGRPKCVVEGQRVLGNTGRLYPIETAQGEIAHLTEGQKICWGGCSGSYAGEKDAVRITTRSGHVVEVGIDHPVLRPSLHCTPAGELSTGDYVGVARRLPEPTGARGIAVVQARLLGLLVGDGNYTRNEVQFTKGDLGVVASLRQCAASMQTEVKQCSRIGYRLVDPTGRHKNSVLDWLRQLGCHGQKSNVKQLPTELFESTNEAVAAFLSGYTDTDGTVSRNHVSWSTASYTLARDIKHLLLRFGVTGIIAQVRTNKATDAWYVNVYAQEQHRILDEVLQLAHMDKAAKLHQLAQREIKNKRHDDGIPYSEELMNTILRAKGSQSWKYLWSGFSRGKLFRRTGCISRHLLRRLAKHLHAPQLLEWADSDIRWERIDSIEPLGERRCWDVTMDNGKHPVFVVEGFLTHNSMKSWVAGKMASHAYLHGNCRVLVYSCEMSTELFEDRVACTLFDLNYEKLKNGSLNDIDWLMYQEALHSLQEDELRDSVEGRHRSIKFSSAFDERDGGGVSHLLAKAEDFSPDIIVVDSFYKMKDDRTGKRSVKWETQYNIVQDLKGITQMLHIPVIGVTQRHRASKDEDKDDEDLGDIAYADAVGQEADAIYRIKKDGMLADGKTVQLRVSMAGSRETRVGGFLLHVVPSTSWRLDSWLDENGKIAAEADKPVRVKDPTKRGGSIDNRRKKEGEPKRKTNLGVLKELPIDDLAPK